MPAVVPGGGSGGDVTSHNADTTNVHGIADTSVLETTSGAQAKADAAQSAAEATAASALSTHTAATTSVHGIADTSALETTTGAQAKADAAESAAALDATTKADAAQAAAEATAAGALSTHAADTTSVHGIADTSALETTSGAQAKADAAQAAAEATAASALSTHTADTTSVHGIADTSVLETTSGAQAKADAAQTAAEGTAASALSTHTADTTSVHGITDTSALVVTTDDRLVPRATTARPAFAPVTVIDPMDTGWTDTYSQGTVAHDTTTKLYGSGSVKLTGPSGTNLFGMKKDLAASEDWSRSAFSIWVRSDDWANITDYSVAVSTGGTGFANFWNIELRPDVTPVRANDEWSQIVFTRGDAAVGSGSPDWSDVQSIIVRAVSGDGTTPSIWFDQFERYPVQDKGIVSIIFDDGYDDTYTDAKPILDEYGMRAGVAIVTDNLGDAGYLTQAQVDGLAASGWDINGHGGTNLTTLTESAADADVRATKQYLMDRGYKGADVYVYPNGGWNDTVHGVVARYFTLARGTDQFLQTATYYPPLNLNGRQVGASIATGTVTGEIDDAATNGTWLILVFHRLVASSPVAEDYTVANFQTIIDHLATADVDVLTISEVGNWTPVAERPIETHSFTVSGEVATQTGAARLYLEDGGRVLDVRASVGTAPTGAALIVDVNRNGTTVFTTQGNRPQIAAGSNTARSTTIENGRLDPGDYLTVDVDQVGSTVAGSDLVVNVRVRRR